MDGIKVIFSQDQIESKVKEIAQDIVKNNIHEDELNFVTVLIGARTFSDDLKRQIMSIESLKINDYEIKLRSYAGNESVGSVKIIRDINGSLHDKSVIIVEDIIDTGITMDFLISYLKDRGARNVRIASFLDKPCRRNSNIKINIDYRGYEVGDLFIVGYGMDYNENYRELPYIGFL